MRHKYTELMPYIHSPLHHYATISVHLYLKTALSNPVSVHLCAYFGHWATIFIHLYHLPAYFLSPLATKTPPFPFTFTKSAPYFFSPLRPIRTKNEFVPSGSVPALYPFTFANRTPYKHSPLLGTIFASNVLLSAKHIISATNVTFLFYLFLY